MSFCVVERSPGLPFSGAVPRVRSIRTGQAAWPKVRAMRSSGVGLRGMRTASRSAATAATPCEEARRSCRHAARNAAFDQVATGSDRSKPEHRAGSCSTSLPITGGIARERCGASPCPADNRQARGRRSAPSVGMRSGRFDRPIMKLGPQDVRSPSRHAPAVGRQRPAPACATVAGSSLRRPRPVSCLGVLADLSGSTRHLNARSSQ